MARETKRLRQRADLSTMTTELRDITSRIPDLSDAISMIGNPKHGLQTAREIDNCAQKLSDFAKGLTKHLKRLLKPPPKPDLGQAIVHNMHQVFPSQCCYNGAVEFGTAQLWKRTVPTIFQAMEDWAEHKELGFFKCTIQEDVMQSINPTKIGRSTVNASGVIQSKVLSLSSFPQGDALACKVLIKEDSSGPEFRAPDLDVDVGEMDYRKLFCSTIDDAKAGIEKPYFVFDAFSTSEWRESVGLPPDSYLDCGDQLNKTPSRIPGVHSAYSYFSTGGGSCTAMHVEDGYLGSINFVLAGAPKVWLFVQPCFREKFESRVREWMKGKGRTSPCSQFVRHQDVLLSPGLLDRWEIPYYIVPCKAGEMIVTLSQTYHQVVNAGANLSEAVNFAAEPDWTGPPSTYRPCTMRCTSGEAPITAADLRVRDNTDGLEPKPKPSLGDHGSDDESNESQDGESLTSSNTADASVDPFDKTVKDVIDDALRSELPYDGTTDGRGKPASSDVVDDTVGGPASKTNLVSANSASTQEGHQATFGDGSAEAPLRLKDEPNDHTVDSVKLPLGLAPVVPSREVKMSLKERIDSLVERTCQYQSVLEISEGDLDRFRPGRKLNDIGIKKALDIILPDKTEPLIASWAIRGFQSSALSEKHTVEELGSSSPQLVHDMDSTHLFIVYNVEDHSLKQPARGSGNHWVLIIVDFLDKKINFYGAKGGLELTARTIAHNTGVFVNAYRVAQGSSDDEIEWKPPRIQQLYPVEGYSDTHNCGIAVIMRAEAFMYPKRAMEVSAHTKPEELAARLEEMRASYLNSILTWCASIHTKEDIFGQLRSKKRPYPLSDSPERTPDTVRKSAFELKRPQPSRVSLERTSLPLAEKWKACIVRAADKKGFNSPGLVKAFEACPDANVSTVLRALQWVCEVANSKCLLQVKEVLSLAKELPAKHSKVHGNAKELAELHSTIVDYGRVSFCAHYCALLSKLDYHETFNFLVKARSKTMKVAHNEREKAVKRQKTGPRNGRQYAPTSESSPLAHSGVSPRPKSTPANGQVRDEIARNISSVNSRDFKTVRAELNAYVREGKRLALLLAPGESQAWKDPRLLSLLPLYEQQGSVPSLDLMGFEPPEQDKQLSKPISSQEFFGFTETLVKFLGEWFFIMRPELRNIKGSSLLGPNPLEYGIEKGIEAGHTTHIRLADMSAQAIRDMKPKDVAKLFEPESVPSQLQLELR